MKIALLRVGIDTGSGGIHGPLFQDGSFEYIPIPDGLNQDNRTYGNTVGRYGKRLVEYFPGKRREESHGSAYPLRSGVHHFHLWRPNIPESQITTPKTRRSFAFLLRATRLWFRVQSCFVFDGVFFSSDRWLGQRFLSANPGLPV